MEGGRSASLYLAYLDTPDYGLDTEDGWTRNVLDAIEGEPDIIYLRLGSLLRSIYCLSSNS